MNTPIIDKPQICYYLREWGPEDKEGLTLFAASGVDILLHAEDIQRGSASLDILQIFINSKVHIISYDVDDKMHHLNVAFKSGLSLGYKHLLYVNNFSANLTPIVLGAESLVKQKPKSLICYTPIKPAPSKLQRIIQRSMQVTGDDYRDFKSEVCCYPLAVVNQIKMGKSSSTDHLFLLVKLLGKDTPVTVIESSRKQEKIKKSWTHRLKEMTYDLWLLALASFKENSSPKKAAISIAVGVFLACTPFYGLQTLLIFSACYIFRLSFPIAFIGSQVSLPPIYSLLVPLQIYVGGQLTGTPIYFDSSLLSRAGDYFYLWLLGSLTVGTILAILLGAIWFVVQTRVSRSS